MNVGFSYSGQLRPAELIEGFLGPDEAQLPFKKDYIHRHITERDLLTKSIANGRDLFLNQDFHLPIIDGKFRHLGPYVFDLGSHGPGIVEPGYLKGIFHGCMYALDHLGKEICSKTYKRIHKKACSHFCGEETNTLTSSEAVGHFYPGDGSDGKISALFLTFSEQPKDQSPDPIIEAIQRYIEERTESLGIKGNPVATLQRIGDVIYVYYTIECGKVVETFIDNLFSEYNQKMKKCLIVDDKIAAIADLFQMLEWTHPFHDGQGRTDLIILNTELVKHGLSPAILDHPYVSTFCLLPDWIRYLKQGMMKWEAERFKTELNPLPPREKEAQWKAEIEKPGAAIHWWFVHNHKKQPRYQIDSEDESESSDEKAPT